MRKALFVSLGGSASILAACYLVPACSSDSTTPGSPTDTGAGSETGSETGGDAKPPTDTGSGTDGGGPEATPGCVGDPGPGDAGIPLGTGTGDPTGGPDKFTLDQAMAGFPAGSGVIYARITTEKGLISCSIDTTNAPITAANFIGLARGTRPYKTSAGWVTGKFYDGLTWHRVIPDFVIQGGDPRGTGTGGPGYSLVNENHVVEPEGALAMAASALPSGSQYYITLGATGLKDYNLFGQCNSDVPKDIAAVPRDGADKPTTPVHMSIVIERCAE